MGMSVISVVVTSLCKTHVCGICNMFETNRGAYADVEWDELDDDVLEEADRCYALLKQEVSQDTPLADMYGG